MRMEPWEHIGALLGGAERKREREHQWVGETAACGEPLTEKQRAVAEKIDEDRVS